jgi:hypothetical protein
MGPTGLRPTCCLDHLERCFWVVISGYYPGLEHKRARHGPRSMAALQLGDFPRVPQLLKGAPLCQCGRASLIVNLSVDEMPFLICNGCGPGHGLS